MMLPIPVLDSEAIALIYNANGEVIDECGNWETAENYVMHDFDCAFAVAIEGDSSSSFYGTTESLQSMLDSRLADRMDCFGI